MTAGNAIVFVDAGYLLKALLIHIGIQSREDVEVDYAGLTEALTDVAEQETGRRVLRQIWYDAARNGRARPEHRALASVPGVHVRLGWIIDTNRGPQQKAVDTALVRDLVISSMRRVADDVVLIAGDGDLAPGLEEAVERGLRVHLWGVSSADPRVRQSEALIALADRRLTLEMADLGLHVRKRVDSLKKQAEDPALSVDAAIVATSALETATSDHGMREPVAEEPPMPQPRPPRSAALGPPPLSRMISPDEQQLDQEQDLDVDAAAPPEANPVGATYGYRWWTRADPGARERFEVVARLPGLPRLMDLDLLASARQRGLDTEDERVRIALRAGFWQGIENARGPSV